MKLRKMLSVLCAAANGYVKEMRATIQALLAETDVTEEQITQQVTSLQASAQAILDLDVPTFGGAQLYVEKVRNYAELVLSKSLLPYSDSAKRMSNPFYAEATPAQRRDAVVVLLLKAESNTYFTQLESVCDHGSSFMAQVAALEDQ